jgi:Polysaccharide lyase
MGINESIVTFITVAASALSAPYALTPDGQVDLQPRKPVPPGACALATPRSRLGMTVDNCRTVFSDTGASENTASTWGAVECEEEDRQQRRARGGDAHPFASGPPQGDRAFRRTSVLDGDDYYGERCELGKNDHREGPTTLYREGQRRATYASFRLARDFPLGVDSWQNVLQMKQAQPADGGGGTPVLSLKAFDGRWQLFHSDPGPTEVDLPIWSTPARVGVWTRFAFDVVYSIDSDRGSVKVYADVNGDGDFADPGEQSPTLITNTLKYETAGEADDGYAEGEPLASHLRAGVYHDPEIDCPDSGCRVDVDNVQVLAP